jgi:hypothetical protein
MNMDEGLISVDPCVNLIFIDRKSDIIEPCKNLDN